MAGPVEPAFYETMSRMQDRHWWYEGRRRILESVLQRVYAEGVPDGTIYDLGCGVGANLALFERFAPTVGVDSSPEAVAYCRAHQRSRVELRDLDRLEGLPDESGSIVVLADVIEHLDDEQPCLAAARRLLKPGGALIVTVPAYMFLWSAADDVSHHRRRYTEPQLAQVIAQKFRVARTSYFSTLLFPPIAAGRFVEILLRRDGSDAAAVPPDPINRALSAIFAAEKHLLARAHLPFGASILCVARKDG